MASVGSDNNDTLSLNIMPLLDVFSILILFLLMSFSTEPVEFNEEKEGLKLPESVVLKSLDEHPAIIITQQALSINDKVLFKLEGNSIPRSEVSQGGITSLFYELQLMSKVSDRIKKDSKKVKKLVLEIDQRIKFKLIKKVMFTAQQAGYVKFKLMVLRAS